jgi:hypothetical protein
MDNGPEPSIAINLRHKPQLDSARIRKKGTIPPSFPLIQSRKCRRKRHDFRPMQCSRRSINIGVFSRISFYTVAQGRM